MQIRRDEREDGVIVSTVEPEFMAWHGKYETAVVYIDGGEMDIKIVAGYDTLEESIKGHEKILNMSNDNFYKLPDLDALKRENLW